LICSSLLWATDPNAIDLKVPEVRLWPKDAPGSEGVAAPEQFETGMKDMAFLQLKPPRLTGGRRNVRDAPSEDG
jgi:hypothetical protein